MKRRGYTLLELLVAVGVGLLLMATLTLALQRGVRAWLFAEEHNSLTSTLQEASRKLKRDLEMTRHDSLQVGPGMLSYPSAFGPTGTAEQAVFAYLPTGAPCWRKQVVVYLDGTALSRREVPIPPDAQAAPGPGPTPLVDYRSGGERWVTGITGFECRLEGSSVSITLTASQTEPEVKTARLVVAVAPRN